MTDMTKRSGAILAFFAALIVLLPTYDKGWSQFDEGFILEGAYMAGQGFIPYKDFFILMYPPGQIYLLAFLIKIFGAGLVAGRLYTVFMQSLICAGVFRIASKVTHFRYAAISTILCLGALAANAGSAPRPMWAGIGLSLIAVSFLIDFLSMDKVRSLLWAGFFTALTTLFRHDIGILTYITALAGLSIYPPRIKKIALYSIFPLAAIGLVALWLYHVGALNDAARSLVFFPREFCKGAAIPFPDFSIDFASIFHGGCLFIKKNCFYIPVLTSIIAATFLGAELSAKRKIDKNSILSIVLVVLGFLYIQQVIVRSDLGHLAAAFPPSAILFGMLFSTARDSRNLFFKAFRILSLSFLSLLMVLFFYRNIELYYKNVVAKPFIKNTEKRVSFKGGAVYVPDDGREDLLYLVDYINRNTLSHDTIYMGSLNHVVPQFGANEIVYYLTGRLPAVKYYEIHPGLQDDEEIQKEMVISLMKNKPPVIVLREYGRVPDRFGPLDRYIRQAYAFKTIKGRDHLYVIKK